MLKLYGLFSFYFFIFIVSSTIIAQNVYVSGKITDSLHNPLGHANILAIPDADEQDV